MATENITATGDWQLIATGPANVAFEPQDAGAEWAIDDDTLDRGHTAHKGRTHSAVLDTAEELYLKGSGVITLTVT